MRERVWFGDGSLGHQWLTRPPAQDTNRSGPRQGRCARSQGRQVPITVRSLAWGGEGEEGEGRRGERFDGSEPHPSSRAPQRSAVQSRFWTEGCVYVGRFSRMVIPRAFSKHRPGAPLLENPSRKVFTSPATFHSGSGSGSVFVRNLGSTRPRTHREPWAMSKTPRCEIETPRPGPG